MGHNSVVSGHLKSIRILWVDLSHPQPPLRRIKGARNYIGTLYLLFHTLEIPSLITE